jgi:hypothetical protein
MRKVLVVVAALAIWATGAYPPWKMSHVYTADESSYEGNVAVAVAEVSSAIGNDWLMNEKYNGWTSPLRALRAGYGYSVDYGRLAIEWAIIAALYWAALQLLPQAGGAK